MYRAIASEAPLDRSNHPPYILSRSRSEMGLVRREQLGALAQLGERLNGIQEVSGSIPLGSTSPWESCIL